MKLPLSPVEWGSFCSLFPVYVLFSPVFRRFPFPLLSPFLSPSPFAPRLSPFRLPLRLSPSISPALYAGIFLYVHSAGLYPACRRPFCRMSSGVSLSFPHPPPLWTVVEQIRGGVIPSFGISLFCIRHAWRIFVPFLPCCTFWGCLSAIFSIYLYFSVFFYILFAYIIFLSYLCKQNFKYIIYYAYEKYIFCDDWFCGGMFMYILWRLLAG